MFDCLFPRPKKINRLNGAYLCPNEPTVLFGRQVLDEVLFAAREYEKKTGYTMDLLPEYAGEITPDITVRASGGLSTVRLQSCIITKQMMKNIHICSTTTRSTVCDL